MWDVLIRLAEGMSIRSHDRSESGYEVKGSSSITRPLSQKEQNVQLMMLLGGWGGCTSLIVLFSLFLHPGEALTEDIDLQLPENVILGSAQASVSLLGILFQDG